MNSQEHWQAEIAELRLQVKFLAKLMYEYKKYGTMMIDFAESMNQEKGERIMKELEAIWKE